MAEEEVLIEVEAVQAVYGDDCLVLRRFPPHLHLHIKPRTADVTSEQFVEAVIEIQAGPLYPTEEPHVCIIEARGLDEERLKQLLNCVQERARVLTSSLMLVALSEEAVEMLSIMNHPDGDCPLCLYPLILDNDENDALSFMKLMSCFHCFHSECIVRWYNWLQAGSDAECRNASTSTVQTEKRKSQDMPGMMDERGGNCPVCRKVFHAKDIEHVLDLAGPHSFQMSFFQSESQVVDDEKILESDIEVARRNKFDTILRLQQENGGLFEPKRIEVIRPGMFLLQSNVPSDTMPEVSKQQEHSPAVTSETNSCGSSKTESTSENRNSHMRKHRMQNSRKPRQWVRKETTAD